MKIFIFLFLFVILLPFSSKALSLDPCDSCKDNIIADLEERLFKLQKIRDDAERGIIESDRIIMKAQQIIILARAKGDVKAGQIAEEALRSAEKSKNEHKKNKEKAEKEIRNLNQLITILKQRNIKNLKDLCNMYREQIDRDKIVLKRFIKNAEELSKRQEERVKEIIKERKELIIDFLSGSLGLMKECKGLFGEYGNIGRIGKGFQRLINSPNLNRETKETFWRIGEKIRYLNIFLDKNFPKITEAAEITVPAIKTAEWSGEMYPKIIAYMKLTQENNEYIKKSLEELEKDLENLVKSDETKTLLLELGLLSLENEKSILSKLVGKYGQEVAKANIIGDLFDFTYHAVKINYLDKEVNGDYKLTEDLFNQYRALKAQFDRDWEQLSACLRECEKYCKNRQ